MRNHCNQVVLENFFEPCLLFLLTKHKSYGYELQKELNTSCDCSVNIGNLYRCLARLVKAGYITKLRNKSEKGPDRLIYSITPSGKKYLKTWIVSLKKQEEVLHSLITNYEK